MMEHRQAQRIPASVKLLVYRKGVPVAIGRMVNASDTGLFVKTEYRDFELNQQLELEYTLPDSESGERHRLRALIVHKNSRGLGLELIGDDPAYQRAVQELVSCLSGVPA